MTKLFFCNGYQKMEKGMDVTKKGHTRKFLDGDETALYIDCTGGYTNL